MVWWVLLSVAAEKERQTEATVVHREVWSIQAARMILRETKDILAHALR